MKAKEFLTALTLPIALLTLSAAITLGCDNKEKVLDVEGPAGGEVEIERDRDTGEVDVDVNGKKDKILDIDTPGADVEVTRDNDNGSVEVDAN